LHIGSAAHDVDCSLAHQLRIVAQAADAHLAVGDRHVEGAAQFDVPFDVVVGQRCFEPLEFEFVEHASHA